MSVEEVEALWLDELERRERAWNDGEVEGTPAELEILDRVQERELAAHSPGELSEARVLRDYLDERINLGKAAELLQLSRFELEGIFLRLGIPLRRGARSIGDAQAEITSARRHV